MDATSDLGSPGAAPPPRPPEGRPGPRQLRRRPDDGHIAGVCAGVAEYFSVDPVLVRIAAVVLLFSGPGFIAYVLAWIFVPAEPGLANYDEPKPRIDRSDRATQIFGIVLLGLGVSVIWGDWWSPLRGWLFPLGLMALGAWLLLRPDRDDDDLPPVPPIPPVPPVPSPPPWAWTTPSTNQPVSTVDADKPTDAGAADTTAIDQRLGEGGGIGADTDTTTVQPTTDAGASDGGYGAGPPPTAPWDVPPSPMPGPPSGLLHDHGHHRHRHHRRRNHVLAPGVFGALLIWAGIAWLSDVGVTTTLAIGLVIIGLGCVLGSFIGGSRALIFPAILVAAALLVSATVDIPLSGPVGEQRWSPDTLAELEDHYEVSMGEGTLDLTDILVPRGDELAIRASVGLGHLIVLVAEDEDVFVNAEVGAGEVLVFGEERNGLGVDLHEDYGSDDDTNGLILNLEVGMGQIEVRRSDSSTTSTTRELG